MKLYTAFTALAAGTTLIFSTGAHADAHMESAEPDGPNVYSMTGELSDVMLVGGVGSEGDQSYGGSWTETQSITTSSGNTVTVTAQCIGMDQPDNNLFDRHLTCTVDDGDGQSGAVLFGCSVEGEANNEMSCVGYLQGKEGDVAGHVSLVTAYYWFMPDGVGKVAGSGHWIR